MEVNSLTYREQKKRRRLLNSQLKAPFWKLKFHESIEHEFLDHFLERYEKQSRWSLIVGTTIFVAFIIYSWIFLPEIAKDLSLAHATSLILLVSMLVISKTKSFARYQTHVLLTFCFVLLTMGLIAIAETQSPYREFIYGTMLLVMIFSVTLIRLLFLHAVVFAVSLIVSLNFVMSYLLNEGPTVVLFQNISIVSGCMLTLTTNYLMERMIRRNFIQMELLNLERIGLDVINTHLRSLVELDPLTSIANRRTFNLVLVREWKRAFLSQSPLSLFMIDIDYFKPFNDSYGHQRGDYCIQQIAMEIKKFANRADDLAARYGGEEYSLILPHTDIRAAIDIGEKLLRAVESQRIPHEASHISDYVTVSIGIATLVPDNKMHFNQIISNADRALYQAKKEGRNRVIHSQMKKEADHLTQESLIH